MTPHRLVVRRIRALASWHVATVEVARRNALVASTEIAQRRQENRDVEAFLAEHVRRRRVVAGSTRTA
jgi:methionyl-tRNA formyltransferase